MSVLKNIKKKKKTKFTSHVKNYLKELSLNIKKNMLYFYRNQINKKNMKHILQSIFYSYFNHYSQNILNLLLKSPNIGGEKI